MDHYWTFDEFGEYLKEKMSQAVYKSMPDYSIKYPSQWSTKRAKNHIKNFSNLFDRFTKTLNKLQRTNKPRCLRTNFIRNSPASLEQERVS